MKKVIETSDRQIKNNVESYYLASDRKLRKQGKVWYKEAQNFVMDLSQKYSVCPFRISGANAYLSINNRWERNKVDTEATVGAFASGKFTKEEFMKLVKVCTYNANKSIYGISILDPTSMIASDSGPSSCSSSFGRPSSIMTATAAVNTTVVSPKVSKPR